MTPTAEFLAWMGLFVLGGLLLAYGDYKRSRSVGRAIFLFYVGASLPMLGIFVSTDPGILLMLVVLAGIARLVLGSKSRRIE